jgi:hypothetical protein
LVEIGTEKNTTIVFPLPIDLFASLMNRTSVSGAPAPSTSR